MKILILLIALCAVAFNHVFSAEINSKNQTKYTNKYNNFDVDSVLNNEKILKNYVKCLLGEGPCTKEGRELSEILPDAIKSECSKCDEKQKATLIKVFKVLNDKYPTYLERLLKKYDPKGEYSKKFKEQILKAPDTSLISSSTVAQSTRGKPETKLNIKPATH